MAKEATMEKVKTDTKRLDFCESLNIEFLELLVFTLANTHKTFRTVIDEAMEKGKNKK